MTALIFAVPFFEIDVEIQKELGLEEIKKYGWVYGDTITDIDILCERAHEFDVLIILTLSNFGHSSNSIIFNWYKLTTYNSNLVYHSLFEAISSEKRLRTMEEINNDNMLTFTLTVMSGQVEFQRKIFITYFQIVNGARNINF